MIDMGIEDRFIFVDKQSGNFREKGCTVWLGLFFKLSNELEKRTVFL
jgi:hypothetical protein